MSASDRVFRVVQLNSRLRGGGTDAQSLALTRGLAVLGWPIHLAGPSESPLAQEARRDLPFRDLPRFRPRQIFTLATFLRKTRAALVHAHHGDDYWTAFLASRLLRPRPRVVFSRHLAKSPASAVSRRHLFAAADAVVAVSRFVAQVLREGHRDPASPVAERHFRPPCRLRPETLHVIHTGIDTAKFHPGEKAATDSARRHLGLGQADTVFGVVGGFDLPVGKGQRVFLRAAQTVLRRIPKAKFLLAGTGSMAAILEGDIRHYGLAGHARLLGQLADPVGLHRALDVLVHPQIATEAFPSVVLEAHACGRPVLASRLDGIPEAWAIGGLGRLVDPGNHGELAEAMLDQAEEPAPTGTEARAAHQRVEAEASVPVQARQMANLYRELMKAPGVPGRWRV